MGPEGTGTMNLFADRPMKDWIKELSEVAGYVVAIGDCATYGGIPAVAQTLVNQRVCSF